MTRLAGSGEGDPVAAFGISQQSGPAPFSVRFLDYSTGAATWSWDFGDGTTTVEREPRHTYALPGRYTVSLTVANNAGAAHTATKYDYIVATGPAPTPTEAPVADFTMNSTDGPAPLAVRFTDASTGTPYHWWWQFGDGTSSTEQNPVHIYERSGSYGVNLTIWTATGSARSGWPAEIEVGPDPRAPVVNFTMSRESGTAPLYVRFTDCSTDATSWRWDFGGLAWSTATNPSVVFRQPGTYTVTLTAKNAYGTSAVAGDVIVTGTPLAGAGPMVRVVG